MTELDSGRAIAIDNADAISDRAADQAYAVHRW
jgi:hypothetical protein